MSVLNGYQGQQAARPQSRTQDPAHTAAAPAWGQQGAAPYGAGQQAHYPSQGNLSQGGPAQGTQAAPPQWPQQAPASPYGQAGYAPAFGGTAPQSNFGQGQDYHFPQHSAAQAAADPYAPQFEPYTPAAAPRAPQPSTPSYAQQGYGQAPAYPTHQTHQHQPVPPQPQYQGFNQEALRSQGHQASHQASWGQTHQQQPYQSQAHQADPRGFDIGGFGHQPAQTQHASYGHQSEQHYQEEPTLGDWTQPQHQHGGYQGGYQGDGQDEMGFAQPAGGELDPAYGEDEIEEEYEEEAPSRFRRPMVIAAALVGAIVIGGGMAQGYKYFLGGGAGGDPPVIKSASGPSKVKPADAGGKQFPHSDSKIMGRLGDGASGTATAATTESDPNGSRKVATLVVGRDGSIQAPPATAAAVEPAPPAAAPAANSTVSVPGMTVVDAFGNQPKPTAADVAAAEAPAAPAAANQKIVVSPPAAPPQKPVTIAKAKVVDAAETGSIQSAAAAAEAVAPPPAKKVKKAAVAATAAADAVGAPAPAASTSVATTGSGYVAVLASVPRSDQSRMTALKQFADMQQKYGSVLAGKTPDVAEANLGAKGNYHRLVVGPPGSRNQAASLCSQLKSQGFNDCWVTSY